MSRIKKIEEDRAEEEKQTKEKIRLEEERLRKEAKEKEDEIQRLKRVEELKPDKDKVLSFIRSLLHLKKRYQM